MRIASGSGAPFLLGVLVLATPVSAGNLEDAMKAEWEGSWVIVKTDLYSDCIEEYTSNEARDDRVTSVGARRFDPGELARVAGVEVRRQWVDLELDLVEPLLVSYPKGSFTLFRERSCRADFRAAVEGAKGQEPGALNRRLASAVLRFATEDEARGSSAWNGRRRDPYPEDYNKTLSEFRKWQYEWAKLTRAEALDRVREYLPKPDNSDVFDYATDFEAGALSIRELDLDNCADLVALLIGPPAREPAEFEDRGAGWWRGRAFAYALEMVRKTADCGEPRELEAL